MLSPPVRLTLQEAGGLPHQQIRIPRPGRETDILGHRSTSSLPLRRRTYVPLHFLAHLALQQEVSRPLHPARRPSRLPRGHRAVGALQVQTPRGTDSRGGRGDPQVAQLGPAEVGVAKDGGQHLQTGHEVQSD